MRPVFAGLLLLAAGLSSAQTPPQPSTSPAGEVKATELADMLKVRGEILKTDPLGQQNFPLMEKQWKHVEDLVAQDKLTTAGDYYLASLVAHDPRGYFERQRLHHELALMALILGEPNAPLLVAHSWERLLDSMGRPSRLGLRRDIDYDSGKPIPAKLDPLAFERIAAVFLNPEEARKRKGDTANLMRLREADQKARGPEAPKLETQADILKFVREGHSHRQQAISAIRAGEFATARDLEAAALVLQHGGDFQSYAMAHELCLASLVLDPKVAAWLSAASYDRMMLGAGHRQRFATQFDNSGLRPFTEGLGDAMRKVVGVQPLAAIRKRSEAIRQRTPGG